MAKKIENTEVTIEKGDAMLTAAEIEVLETYDKQITWNTLFGTNPEYVYRWVNEGQRKHAVEMRQYQGWVVDQDDEVYTPSIPKGTAVKRYGNFILMRRKRLLDELLREKLKANTASALERIESQHYAKGANYIRKVLGDDMPIHLR